MKPTRTYLFLFLLGFLVITSCERTLDLEVKEFESRLVVNSTFTEGSSWIVNVSSSANVLDIDSQIGPIETAIVSIICEETGNIFLLGHLENGIYSSREDLPEVGYQYSLKIINDGFKDLTASDKIAEAVSVDNIDTESISVDGSEALQIDFSIENSSVSADFYIVDIVQKSDAEKYNIDISTTIADEFIFTTEDNNADDVTPDFRFKSRLFFSDMDFDGQKQNISIISHDPNTVSTSNSTIGGGTTTTDGSGGTSTGEESAFDPELQLRILSVSKNLFEYYKSVEAYRWNRNNNSSFSTPPKIISNVEGGLGIFGAYTIQFKDLY